MVIDRLDLYLAKTCFNVAYLQEIERVFMNYFVQLYI